MRPGIRIRPSSANWYRISNVADIASPALIVYRDRVEQNLQRMLAIAGDPARLRPHMKTHKMREMLELQLELGISKFKCATLAEAELAAKSCVPDVLLAYQPVGPSPKRLAELIERFPKTKFSVIADDPVAVLQLSRAVAMLKTAKDGRRPVANGLDVLLDLDVGFHRTGVPIGPKAGTVYSLIASLEHSGIKPGGFHAYDGQIVDSDVATRATACEQAFAPVLNFRQKLIKGGLPVPRIVAGGTPTFPMHAGRADGVECSPGTCVFWDAGYSRKLRDLKFIPAALVLTRVVSKPGPNRLCLDLGHKAIASEMPHPRVHLIGLEDSKAVMHSEEHFVVETRRAKDFKVGDCVYGIPWHICPTVALHSAVTVVKGGKAVGQWKVAARDRL